MIMITASQNYNRVKRNICKYKTLHKAYTGLPVVRVRTELGGIELQGSS